MNVLLIYPAHPDAFWSFRHALRFISRKAYSPPLGLLTVAAMLPQSWSKRLVDLNARDLDDKDIQWADLVFISAMDSQYQSTRDLLPRIKQYGKKIVAGGPLFTMDPDRLLGIDHLLLHEVEETLPRFLEDLEKGEAQPVYRIREWPELHSSPVPAWDLVDLNDYSSMSLQYSRGCPFECEFCHIEVLNGRSPRFKSTDQIIGELEVFYRRGWRGAVFFVDDNFIMRPQQLKEDLLPAMIAWMEEKKYPFFYYTQLSVNLADDEELIALMVRAGFDTVFIGIESPEEKSLAETNKHVNLRQDLLPAVIKIQSLGLQVNAGFILGFDHDTPATFAKHRDFIQDSGILGAMIGLLHAGTGTKLYNRLRSENRLLEDSSGDNTDYSTNFIPRMGHSALLSGYQKLVQTIYSPPFFYERLKTFFRHYRQPRRPGPSFQFSDLKALFRILWVIGLLAEERKYFWTALLRLSVGSPRAIPLFIRLAVYGYHFRMVYQKTTGDS
jgi:radical SAM superfamily enzyme YgiQ (UPF0313 family)